MEEIVQSLEQTVENVRGVDMVPLAVALQAVQAASSINLLTALEEETSDLNKLLSEYGLLGDLTSDIEE